MAEEQIRLTFHGPSSLFVRLTMELELVGATVQPDEIEETRSTELLDAITSGLIVQASFFLVKTVVHQLKKVAEELLVEGLPESREIDDQLSKMDQWWKGLTKLQRDTLRQVVRGQASLPEDLAGSMARLGYAPSYWTWSASPTGDTTSSPAPDLITYILAAPLNE